MFGLRLWLILVLMALAGSGVLAQAAAPVPAGPLRFGGFVFPEDIAGARRGSFRDYEPQAPGFGQSVSYVSARRTVFTVYVYDKRLTITEANAAGIARGERDEAARDIEAAVKQGSYDRAEPGDASGVLTPEMGAVYAARYRLSLRNGETRDSYAAVQVARGKIVKVRATGSDLPQTEGDVRAFLLALGTVIASGER